MFIIFLLFLIIFFHFFLSPSFFFLLLLFLFFSFKKVSAGYDHKIALWGSNAFMGITRDPSPSRYLAGHGNGVIALATSEDGLILSGSLDKYVQKKKRKIQKIENKKLSERNSLKENLVFFFFDFCSFWISFCGLLICVLVLQPFGILDNHHLELLNL